MINFDKYRLFPALLWLLFVTIAILTPGNNLPKVPLFPFADKLIHVGVFAVLSFLWARVGTLESGRKIKWKNLLTNLLVFSVFFPIFIEYLQMYVPNRSFELEDILANLFGGLIGFSGFIILHKAKSSLV
ncbi:VanZ family protein [Cecembia rubra]|uniref:VanZ like protein n=1 Tax=Cecembia rubra TaxID=1485585 RepID=A0A2P8E6K8_9BACT|nr:VanZ family protein [Cecembia rubra]PSL05093.1 VanZ like protein [Cecembia rubra]